MKKLEVYAAQDQHFKIQIQILNLQMSLEKLCPNLSFVVENKMVNSHKKGGSNFKLNINNWDILFPWILRIYHWIGSNILHYRKWNEPIGNSAHNTECFAKRLWRYIFLAYVYKFIALVNKLKRLWILWIVWILSLVFTIIFRFLRTLLITLILMRDTCVAWWKFKIIVHINI